MSDNIENAAAEMSQVDLELAEELQAWQNKVKELQAYYNLLKQENTQVKKKHSGLQQKLAIATETLETNTRIFGELYEDSKTALQMGRDPYLNSTISVKVPSPKAKNVKVSPKRKISGSSLNNSGKVLSSLPVEEPVRRRKIENLEPISMHYDDLDGEEPISEEINSPPFLSVIEEENTIESGNALPERRPYVRVTLLPEDILAKHMQNAAGGDSVLDTSSGENLMLASTPKAKLEHMRGLGLSPALNLSDRFSHVTVRRRGGASDEACSSSGSKKSMKFERGSSSSSKKSMKFESPLEKEAETSGRPSRRAKPEGLKEPSLRRKLRR